MNKYIEIFWRFLCLGLLSFGGPAAHIGYFQQAFVKKRGWLSQSEFSQLVALSQFLPGPASSQVGFAIGLQKAGIIGGITAFIAFTLPSFLLMLALAIFSFNLSDSQFTTLTSGLTLLAIIVISDAVVTLFNNFCHSIITKAIMVTTSLSLLLMPNVTIQMALLALAAIIGYCGINTQLNADKKQATANPINRQALNLSALGLFFLLFIILSFIPQPSAELSLFNTFYQAGSMVFGGGHVVLPLLAPTMTTQMSEQAFLTGYAAAQAVPGPMFTLATYLGAQSFSQAPISGAIIATLGIFLPGFLLMIAFYRGWKTLLNNPKLAAAVAGVNAAVVGLLLATLISPVSQHAIHNITDILLVISGFILLRVFKLPILALVILFAAYGGVSYYFA